MSASTVLIVDDERTLARSIKAFLSEFGYDADVAGSAEEALGMMERFRPDVVFADLRLPGMGGLELLKRIHDFDPGVPVVIMTAYGTIEGAVEAVKRGAFDYLKKPLDLDELKLLADRARETSLLKQELTYHRQRDERGVARGDMVGSCPPMQNVMEQVHQIAALDDTPPVLLVGETGTGKGLVARVIHSASKRSTKAFIEVTCTALPQTLIEAELFGYERGAFTDAKESKVGLFEAAEGGFLFLDEVGDIELALQGKLLSAIENRTVRRVGGLRARTVDVRILAATNRDLEREAREGRFRMDLYFRLAGIVLQLPPLRERGDDIIVLAEQFLRRFSAKYGKEVRTVTAEAATQLRRYPWPGNVRELSHVIERAVLWSRGKAVELEHLSLVMPADWPPPARQSGEVRAASGAIPSGATPALPPPGIHLDQWEQSMIEEALREAGGNQAKAARRLGISRDTLRYRLKKFGLV